MKKKLFAILISFYANSLISMEGAAFAAGEIPNSQTVGSATIVQSSQQDRVVDITQQQSECSVRCVTRNEVCCVLRGTRNALACLILLAGSGVAAWYFGYYVVSPMLP